MRPRGFIDAVEDARGVLATFDGRQVADDDCIDDVREAIRNLDAAIDLALMNAGAGQIDPADRLIVERRARELVLLWDTCGSRTQALILDMKTLFGRYIDL